MYTCPSCGETKNLHYNYDYSKQHRPVLDVMCNICGEFFDGDIPVSQLTKQPVVSDNFQIGPDGAYEHDDTPSIYESPDKGETVYKRKAGDYTNRTKL